MEYVPGPDDELVLRYLYNAEYPTYDKSKDDFVYYKIPPSGKIPEYDSDRHRANARGLLSSACNDLDASVGSDPFCNRFDRGSKAEDIVNSYFDMINDNLLARLYSVVGGGAIVPGPGGSPLGPQLRHVLARAHVL